RAGRVGDGIHAGGLAPSRGRGARRGRRPADALGDGPPANRRGLGPPRLPGTARGAGGGAVDLERHRQPARPGGGGLGGRRPLAATVTREGMLRWGGFVLLPDGVQTVRVVVPPARLRGLRLSLTAGDPVFDWSIHELTVFADD